MNRLGLGLAATALVIVGACGGGGGGGSDRSEPAATSKTPQRMSLAEACPLVYQATSDSNGGDTVTEEIANYEELSKQLDSLEDQSDAEGANAIRAYGDAVEARVEALNSQSATPTEKTQSLADEWSAFGDYGKLCQAAGADLS